MNLGLLGKDIKYSLSPKIFKKISRILNIKINYTLIDEEKEVFDEIINNLRLGILDGLNVTKPYKEKIDQILSSIKLSTFDALWLSYIEGMAIGGIIMLIIS